MKRLSRFLPRRYAGGSVCDLWRQGSDRCGAVLQGPHLREAVRELRRRCDEAFALMSVIPLLVCAYLLTVRIFSWDILVGLNGFYFLLAVSIAVGGILRGRFVIQSSIAQLVRANQQSRELLASLRRNNALLQQEISMRVEANAALLQSEARFRHLFESGVMGLAVVKDGRIVEANPLFLRMTGCERAELPLPSASVLPAGIVPDAAVGRRRRGSSAPRECELLRRDGSGLPVLAGAVALDAEGGEFLCLILDISERRMLEQRLVRARQFEILGKLAAGIAHEINTPIQYIGSNLSFLRRGFTEACHQVEERVSGGGLRESEGANAAGAAGPDRWNYFAREIPKAIDEALTGVKRAGRIVHSVYGLAHTGNGEPAEVDINGLIGHAATVLRNKWKGVAELDMRLDSNLPPVRCIEEDIRHCLLNVLLNAVQAVEEKSREDGGEGRVKGVIRVRTLRRGDWAEIRICDSGCGIPEAVRAQIFEPFFTTKPVGQGTGQGLALARTAIVQRHQGVLRCRSRVGTGTCFLIRLPLMGDATSDG